MFSRLRCWMSRLLICFSVILPHTAVIGERATAEDGAAVDQIFRECKKLQVRLSLENDQFVADLSHCRHIEAAIQLLESFSIRTLNLSGSVIQDEQMELLGKLTQVKSIDLSNTNISDQGIDHCRNWENLEFINVEQTRCTTAGLQKLLESKKLRTSRHLESAVLWAPTLQLAQQLAKKQDRLLFVLHVSGDFEQSNFT